MASQLSASPPELAAISQELQEVEWLAPGDGEGVERGEHLADHWSFELSLVVLGALMGVAVYFWMG